jgi:3-keto-5-aminohexanoate cleavage enzyme
VAYSEGAFPLSFCPTGMVPMRSDSPSLPLTAEEIAEQVLEAAQLGITSVHLHARRSDGSPAWEVDYYEDIIARIRRDDPELVICVTTSGRVESELGKRSQVLSIDGANKPDMASLTLSSMNFATAASINGPEVVKFLARTMASKGIKPELEVFDTGMLNYVDYLASKGLLTPPYVVNFIMGGPATVQAGPLELGLMLARLPMNSVWLAGGIGRSQLTAATLALASGGGVRVGLEDNLFFDKARTRLASNRDLVQRVLSIAEHLELAPMSSPDFRNRWLNG